MIHTDDIAWHHSRFDWSELLARSVLQPIRNGQPVGYRPPGWESHGRTGAIEVPTGLDARTDELVRELERLLPGPPREDLGRYRGGSS